MKTEKKSAKTVNNLNDLPAAAAEVLQAEAQAEATTEVKAEEAAPAQEAKQPEVKIFENATAVSGDPQAVENATTDSAIDSVSKTIADAILKLKVNEDELSKKIAANVVSAIDDKIKKPEQESTWKPNKKNVTYAIGGGVVCAGIAVGLCILFGGN